MKNLNVGIIGGSIAGCATAISLSKLGHHVKLYERSLGKLEDRGAGIGLPIPTLENLQSRGLLGVNFPYLTISDRYYKIPNEEYMGRTIWTQSIGDLALTNWGSLYRDLRSRVSDEVYHAGQPVTKIDQDEQSASIHFTDNSIERFDLVICADGVDSLGRATVCPPAKVNYAGYIAWRGFIPETEAPNIEDPTNTDNKELIGQHALMSDRGHGIMYLIPGLNGETKKGERLVNWLWYENVDMEDLDAALDGRKLGNSSVQPGFVPQYRIDYLRNQSLKLFPAYFSDIVQKTEKPFIQSIFDMHSNVYSSGRLCILGDAATTVRPNSASGVIHGMTNAIKLADSLSSSLSLEEGLATWNNDQVAYGNELVEFSRKVGKALQDPATNWKSMDPSAMKSWWDSVMGEQSWYVTDSKRRN